MKSRSSHYLNAVLACLLAYSWGFYVANDNALRASLALFLCGWCIYDAENARGGAA